MEKPKVLVIDDELVIHKTMEKALKNEGYSLLFAQNGQEGLKILKQTVPDLIFLDLRMPVMDGFKFLKKIKIAPDDPFLVVVITAQGDDQDVKKSFDLGVNFYLRKPLSMIEICGLTKRCLELKAIEKEIRAHRDNLERLVEERTQTIQEQLHFQQHLIDSIPTPIFFKDMDFRYQACNTAFEEFMGVDRDQAIGKTIHDIAPENLAKLHTKKDKQTLKKGNLVFESSVPSDERGSREVEVTMATFNNTDNVKAGVIGAMFDITDRKEAQEALSVRTQQLEEANSTLRIVLEQIGNAKLDVEKKVFRNIKELILPDLEKLKTKMTGNREKTEIDVIKSNLAKLTSSQMHKLSSLYMAMSPREIQIADFVRMGKSNKSIALMLNISRSAVEFHRNNLREKLGIKNQRLNLRSYLMNLE